MNKKVILFFVLSSVCVQARATKTLRLVATTPDLADIAKRVGGEHVSIDTIAKGPEDIHQVQMRPSFVTKLNRADAVVYLGLSVEHSFLPGLLDVARNPAMRPDPDTQNCLGPGCIDCSIGLKVMEKPESLSRAQGELHPQGNPHYNLGPDSGPLIAENVEKGLAQLDSEHAADYEKNLKAYLAELEPKLAEWRKLVAPLKGMKAVSFHKDVAYLGRFTGLDFVDTVELKPGVAPTPTHLEKLVLRMKAENVKLIVREQQYEAKTCEWLAEQTGAKIAVIGTLGRAFPDTDTFIKMAAHNVKAILAAAGKN